MTRIHNIYIMMMKKLLPLLLVLLFPAAALQAQEAVGRKGRLGISWSYFGENAIHTASRMDLVGAPSYRGDGFFALGVHYQEQLNPWLQLEQGLEFSDHSVLISAGPIYQEGHLPLIWGVYRDRVTMLNLPVTLKASFLRYFFVNMGTMLTLDIGFADHVDSQTGLGSILGLGVQYQFKPGFSLFVNPYQKVHSLVPIFGNRGANRQMVWESGLRFGFQYPLPFNKNSN